MADIDLSGLALPEVEFRANTNRVLEELRRAELAAQAARVLAPIARPSPARALLGPGDVPLPRLIEALINKNLNF